MLIPWFWFVVLVLVLLSYAVPRRKVVATVIVTVDERGVEFMDRILRLSEGPKTFRSVPKNDAGVVDETIENLRRGYDSAAAGSLTAADGSSSLVSNGLEYTVTPIAASPVVDGVIQFSEVETDLDPDTTPGVDARIAGRSRFAVVADDTIIATRIDDEEVVS